MPRSLSSPSIFYLVISTDILAKQQRKLFSLNNPVLYVSLGRVEVDADLGDRFAGEGKALAIVLQVYLLHRRLRTLVQLQLEEVEVGLCEHHYVHPAFWGVHLYVHQIVGEQGEDDVEHLLVVTLVVCDVAVGHRAKEVLQQPKGTQKLE